MRLVDVVNQIRYILPKHSNALSTTIGVGEITCVSGTATITTTSNHGLSTGEHIVLSGYSVTTSISDVSKDGLQVTFTTAADHDLTENWQEEVTLGGFTDDVWNTSFSLTRVPNRRTFVVTTTNSLPVLNGEEYLLEERCDGINGYFEITKINNTKLTITGDFIDGTYIGGTFNSKLRIVGAVSLERFLQHYTAQNVSSLYICVVMSDANTSKDRSTMTDAIYNPVNGAHMRMTLIDGFTVYVVGNASDDIAAQAMIDVCRHDMLIPILRSLYGVRFPTGLSNESDYRTIFTGHGTSYYDKAIYVHEYEFQLSMELTDSDVASYEDERAFRDIDYIHSPGDDDNDPDTTLTVDLDDEPLDR